MNETRKASTTHSLTCQICRNLMGINSCHLCKRIICFNCTDFNEFCLYCCCNEKNSFVIKMKYHERK